MQVRLSPSQKNSFLSKLTEEYPNQATFKKAVLTEIASRCGIDTRYYNDFINPDTRVEHGKYCLHNEILAFKPNSHLAEEVSVSPVAKEKPKYVEPVVQPIAEVPQFQEHKPFVPKKSPDFVNFGNFALIKKIIRSGEFFPIFISGMSGTGKTFAVKQACAVLKREYIRVQINPDTDEADLFGGYRLLNGNTIWQDGPVTVAAKTGAICLLDEIDRTSNKIISLNGILEGEPFLNKKTGELITPKPGFNVIATGNTKGRGSDSGRYTYASIIDEALLERFPISIEFEFPKKDIIKNILSTFNTHYGADSKSEEFVEELASWGVIISEAFHEDAIEDMISIRRLVHILKTFHIIGNPLKSIKLGINRFDEISQVAFLDLFQKISKIDFTVAEAEQDDDDDDKFYPNRTTTTISSTKI